MIKAAVLSLLATLLVAQNPKVYSALGDIVYDSVESIEKLKEISKSSQYEEKINSYIKEVYIAKDIGFAIEAGDKRENEKVYLEKIRALSKINDFFHRIAIDYFKSSMVTKDNELFSQTINSGLIDTQKYKSEILEYYFAHCVDMNATGVIQKYLDEDEILRKLQESSKKVKVTKKEIQEAKIRRIRQKDKAKQEAIQKTLEEELIKKKSDIRKEQIEELKK